MSDVGLNFCIKSSLFQLHDTDESKDDSSLLK